MSLRFPIRRAAWTRLVSVLLGAFLFSLAASTPAGATGTEQIDGSGSSWAYNAISQWISDVTAQGLQVVFTPSGSAQGRQDFANGVTDFGVSDIGYQGQDPETGQTDGSNRLYAYLPIVGGATTFPYNLTVAGHQVQNLRLSGDTLAKIFTDQITNWDDPEITGRAFGPGVRAALHRAWRPRRIHGRGGARMATLTIVFWRDIPGQVIVKAGRKSAKRELSERFIRAIDAAAMRSGATETDAYLADWRRADPLPCGDDLETEASAAAERLEADYDNARLAALAASEGRET